jgi:hypothetical protein
MNLIKGSFIFYMNKLESAVTIRFHVCRVFPALMHQDDLLLPSPLDWASGKIKGCSDRTRDSLVRRRTEAPPDHPSCFSIDEPRRTRPLTLLHHSHSRENEKGVILENPLIEGNASVLGYLRSICTTQYPNYLDTKLCRYIYKELLLYGSTFSNESNKEENQKILRSLPL